MRAPILRLVISTILLLGYVSISDAADQCMERESGRKFGRWFTPDITLTSKMWSKQVVHGLTDIHPSAFRLLLAVNPDATDREWNIVVRDEDMHVLVSLGAVDFAASDGSLSTKRWTGMLQAGALQIDLLASPDSDVVANVLEGVAFPNGSNEPRLFSTQTSTPNWIPLYSDSGSIPRRSGDSVGMLIAGTEGQSGETRQSWCCSGVMLTADLLLTNWHCGGIIEAVPAGAYWNPDIRDSTVVDLGWDDGPVRRQYSATEVVARAEDLDFALLRVRPLVGSSGASGQAVPARVSLDSPVKDEPIFLIHHASCMKKLISEKCRIVDDEFQSWFPGWTDDRGAFDGKVIGPEFSHSCDTEPGASGGAVFDIEGRLIGLHHLGFQTNNSCVPDKKNKAVKIGEIIQRIQKLHPEVINDIVFR